MTLSDYMNSIAPRRGGAAATPSAPNITPQTNTVIGDLNANNFAGAWNTALSTSPLYGTNYGAPTTDPLLKDLESSAGLKALDPTKQWNPQELAQFYQALQQNPVYQGQSPSITAGGSESLGQNPYGLWGSSSGIPGDISANLTQEGTTPDVGRFLGARPGKGGFFENPVNDVLLAAGLAAGGVGLAGGFGAGAAAGAGAADTSALTAGAVDTGLGAADIAAGTDALSAGIGDLSIAGADTGAAAGVGAGAAGATGDLLPEQVVTAAAPGAITAGASPDLLAGPLLANAIASPGSVSDIGQTLNTGQFLSPSDTSASLQNLSPEMASSLGIDLTPTGFDASSVLDPSADALNIAGDTSGGGPLDWLKNPKNAATAGLLGLSLKSAMSSPKLPGALGQAGGNASALAKSALPIIESGGTAGPQWAQQKASIDATIDQEIEQQKQSLMQAAVNSGMGNQNSGVVQQQIAEMTRRANVQRQQLYRQAQDQNVQNAISELSGGDQTLTAIGATQLQQDEQARAEAAQTAELALLLQAGTGIPGSIFGKP